MALGAIYIGSSAAFNAFVGVGVICLGASYAMPVAVALAGGRRAFRVHALGASSIVGERYVNQDGVRRKEGQSVTVYDNGPPFTLGRWGAAINAVAVLWVIFEIVLFSMPDEIPVTRSSMSKSSYVSFRMKGDCLTTICRLCIGGFCRIRCH